MAVVRPEFRVDVYLPVPRIPCWVPGGARFPAVTVPARRTGCATGTVFAGVTRTGRRWRVSCRSRARAERTPGSDDLFCDRMPLRQSRFRVMHRHRAAWVRAGRPDPGTWSARAGLLGPGIHSNVRCRSAPCGPSTRGTSTARPTRRDGAARAVQNAEYLAHCQRVASRASTSTGWRPSSNWSCSTWFSAATTGHDHRRAAGHRRPIRTAKNAEVTSLLNLSAEQWRELAGPKDGDLPAVL